MDLLQSTAQGIHGVAKISTSQDICKENSIGYLVAIYYVFKHTTTNERRCVSVAALEVNQTL